MRGELRVAKNTLVRRAIRETNFAGLDSQLGGPVGLIFSFEDPIAVAKTVTSFKEAGEKFKLRGGVLEGKPLTPRGNPGSGQHASKRGRDGPIAGPACRPRPAPWCACSTSRGRALARVIDAIGKKNGEAASSGPAASEAAAPEAATGEVAS